MRGSKANGGAAGRVAAWRVAAIAGAVTLPMGACGDDSTGPGPDPFAPAPDDTIPYVYAAPPAVGDGWEVARAGDVGLSETRLEQLVEILRLGTYANVHGILIVKDDRLVLEEYFNGFSFEGAVGDSILGSWTTFDRTVPHNLASVTKSITSTLVGIAVEQGFLSGVDTAVYDFFPEHADLRDARKDSITLEHLLTMTSGLGWDESTYVYGDPRNDINALFAQADPIRYVLVKPAVDPPGTTWLYNGGGTNVLGEVVRRAAGRSLPAFADEYLFGPLGIGARTWVQLPGAVAYASGDLKLRPRDMAKVGYLYVNEGRWDGTRVLPESWIAAASADYAETWNPGWWYGYQWWNFDWPVDGRTHASFGARGWGGQAITIFPELHMVVVLTGGNYRTPDPIDAVIAEFVLDALEG